MRQEVVQAKLNDRGNYGASARDVRLQEKVSDVIGRPFY